jgi:hypothetical protein
MGSGINASAAGMEISVAIIGQWEKFVDQFYWFAHLHGAHFQQHKYFLPKTSRASTLLRTYQAMAEAKIARNH